MFALTTGMLVSWREDGDFIHGRITEPGDIPVQIRIKRQCIKDAIKSVPIRSFVSVSGPLELVPKLGKSRKMYIEKTIHVEQLTILGQRQEPKGLLSRVFKQE